MKRMKKMTSVLMAGALTAGSLTGFQCTEVFTDDDPYEVVVSYITLGSDPQDLGMVEEALSEYTKEKINCTVKFKTVPISNRTSQYNLWASSGEKIDLFVLYNQDISSYVNEGKILEVRLPQSHWL